MRRPNWKTVSTLISMIVVAGCSDNLAAPTLQSSSPASVQLAPAGRPTLSLNTMGAASVASSFTVGPRGGVFLVGTNAVVFPAGSICDPSTSSYGADTWDTSCEPLTSAITVKYVTTVVDGRTAVDFKTPLRFVPSTDASRWVWIYMYTPAAVGATDLSPFTIYYTPTLGGQLVDESTADATLRTYVDTHTGVSVRRIKHFSGYTSWGGSCDGSAITSCPDSSGSSTP